MDEDGYPEEEELQDIRDAAGFQPEDACALLERVRQLWHWPNYATNCAAVRPPRMPC
jgi:hypothetical protein